MTTPTIRPMPAVIAGIRLPDTSLARAATELVREVSAPALFNHVVRTYIFGEQIGRSTGMRYDSEFLYIAAVMHDLGLTPAYVAAERFEVDGADAAARFLAEHKIAPEKIDLVWDAIALHSSNGIAHRKEPGIALVHFGAAVDVVGAGLDQIPPEVVHQTLESFPRLGFKKAFLQAIADVLRKKPETGYLNFMEGIGKRYITDFQAPDICEVIMGAPYEE